MLVASRSTACLRIDHILRVLVIGRRPWSAFAVYEARTKYNFFGHLAEFVPILDKQEREASTLRGGQLRVHASSQHPIAFGVALIMMLPFAVYLAKRASTVRAGPALVGRPPLRDGGVTTVSRTTVLMILTMGFVALRLRGAASRPLLAGALSSPSRSTSSLRARSAASTSRSSPKEGLIGDVQGRAGEAGSGRFADVGRASGIWTESRSSATGPGAQIAFQREETHLGPAPIPPVIFDNQYMARSSSSACSACSGRSCSSGAARSRLFRAAKPSTGPPSDLMTACAVVVRRLRGGHVLLRRVRVRAGTIVFVFVAALGLRAARLQRRRPAWSKVVSNDRVETP